MAYYKILTKNSIEHTNIDGARNNHFNSGMRNGIVKGAFTEGRFFATENVIALDPCELRISGHRIVLTETWSYTFNSYPTTPKKYALIAQIQVTDDDVLFSLFVQDYNTELIKENLFVNETGKGTYQERIGVFTLNTNSTVSDVLKTIDIITGGTSKDNGTEKGTEVFVDEEFVEELIFDKDPQQQLNKKLETVKEETVEGGVARIEVNTENYAGATSNRFYVSSIQKYQGSGASQDDSFDFEVNNSGVYYKRGAMLEMEKLATVNELNLAVGDIETLLTALNTGAGV